MFVFHRVPALAYLWGEKCDGLENVIKKYDFTDIPELLNIVLS